LAISLERAQRAYELYTSGMSFSEIKNQLGCLEDTARRYVSHIKQINGIDQAERPKILLLDIETAPMVVYVWGLYLQKIEPHKVIKDWCWTLSNKKLFIVSCKIRKIREMDQKTLTSSRTRTKKIYTRG